MMMIHKSIWIKSTDTVVSSVVRLKDVSHIHYPYNQIQLVLERFNKNLKKNPPASVHDRIPAILI